MWLLYTARSAYFIESYFECVVCYLLAMGIITVISDLLFVNDCFMQVRCLTGRQLAVS